MDAWGRSQWPRGLRRRFAAVRLLRLWFRIPPGAWMSVCCDCRELSSRGLCIGLITRTEEFYQLWFVVVCDLENSWMRRPWPTWGCRAERKKKERKGHLVPYSTCLYPVDTRTSVCTHACTSTRKHDSFHILFQFWNRLLLWGCTFTILRHLVFLGVVRVIFSPDFH
jgi:hypothetical protein